MGQAHSACVVCAPCCFQLPKCCGRDAKDVAERCVQDARFDKDAAKNGVAIVTGTTLGGIGAYTAEVLAGVAGYHVVLAGRNTKKLEATQHHILSTHPNAKTTCLELDLASFASVRQFAKAFLDTFPDKPLKLLVNNAAVMAPPFALSDQGYEMQMHTNHLSHFLLTSLLEDKLRASAPARVVCVSSAFHALAKPVPTNLAKGYSTAIGGFLAYGRSKTANMLHARELAHRLRDAGVSAFSLHPGAIDSQLGQHNFLAGLYYGGCPCMNKTVGQGAATTVFCALKPGLEVHSGAYFKDCAVNSPLYASDRLARELWDASEKAVMAK